VDEEQVDVLQSGVLEDVVEADFKVVGSEEVGSCFRCYKLSQRDYSLFRRVTRHI
jgi:hypothetical protein